MWDIKISELQYKYFRLLDLLICTPFLMAPLFINLPYRVNIFLSWEGAYRLYLGQVPYQDFGLPMGFGYWLIPALFFKLFGPSMFSLIKAQVLINAISLISIRGILYNLKVKPIVITTTLLIFCLTYIIYNFWPWYNHTVVVFEIVGLFFATQYVSSENRKLKILWVILAGIFMFLSFFTKQDVGAIGFVIALFIISYYSILHKEKHLILIYIASFFGVALITILPFIDNDFLYWFNYGQPPHSSRLSLLLLIDSLIQEATWEKIYLSLFILLFIGGATTIQSIWTNTDKTILTAIGLGLIGQAVVTRVSSPLPTDHMTYFHSFAFVMLVNLTPLSLTVNRLPNAVAILTLAVFCFSSGYWKYISNWLHIDRKPGMTKQEPAKDPWLPSSYKGFERVTMPKSTIEGIERLLESPVAKKDNLKVLNMTELTPLALNLNYTPLKNEPLWYHLRVGIFQKEVEAFCEKIKNKEYDIVLFEDIPSLNNFYPYQVRDTLYKYYHVQDQFLAPRKLEDSKIEVFVK